MPPQNQTGLQRWQHRMMQRWGLGSTRQLWVVLAVFAITGSSSVWVGRALRAALGLDDLQPDALRLLVRFLFIFPVYQVLLLLVGAAFGQFAFFWDFTKRMARFIVGRKRQ